MNYLITVPLSVRLGPARSGSVRLGPARSGKGCGCIAGPPEINIFTEENPSFPMTSAILPLPNIWVCPENINSALCWNLNTFVILVWVARLFCGKEKSEPPGQPHPGFARIGKIGISALKHVILFIKDTIAIDIEINMFPLVSNLGIDQFIGVIFVLVRLVQIGFSVTGHVSTGIKPAAPTKFQPHRIGIDRGIGIIISTIIPISIAEVVKLGFADTKIGKGIKPAAFVSLCHCGIGRDPVVEFVLQGKFGRKGGIIRLFIYILAIVTDLSVVVIIAKTKRDVESIGELIANVSENTDCIFFKITVKQADVAWRSESKLN